MCRQLATSCLLCSSFARAFAFGRRVEKLLANVSGRVCLLEMVNLPVVRPSRTGCVAAESFIVRMISLGQGLGAPQNDKLRPQSVSQSVSQLFHGPAPRSPLHRLAVRLRHSRSNTSTEYSLPGATQLRPQTTDELPARRQDARPGCGSSLSLTPARCPSRERNSQLATLVSWHTSTQAPKTIISPLN